MNLSPRGEWNLFRFAAERTGMREERASGEVAFELRSRASGFSVEAELTLPFRGDLKFRAGLASVLRLDSGEIQYWALAHTRAAPDFHAADAFLFQL